MRGALPCAILALAVASLACGDSSPSGPAPTATPATALPSTPVATAPAATETATPVASSPSATATPAATALAATETATPAATTPAATETPPPTASPTQTRTPAPPPGKGGTEDEASLAAELAATVIAPIAERYGKAADSLEAHAFPLGLHDARGALWAVVTQGMRLGLAGAGGSAANFYHFAALYRRASNGAWSEALSEVTLETAPWSPVTVELFDPGPRAGGEPAVFIAIYGFTGAHSGTFDVLFVEGERMAPALSHISASPPPGSLDDLDGDGVVEIIFNTSNSYVFFYASDVKEKSELIYRWGGLGYEAVEIAVTEELPEELEAAAGRVVKLAGANLWRNAAALAVETARQAPEHERLRWLSIAVNRMATLRLEYAGAYQQPLLSNVFAGEYGAALALMRQLPPAEAFALDGPLIIGGTAAMLSEYLLLYTDRALKVRDDDPAIHAVRALGQTLAWPDSLERARSSIARAVRLAPNDAFLQEAKAFLDSVAEAPGVPADGS